VDRRRKRIAAIGAATALAVAGGGVAFAAANANDHRDALLRDAAQRLNVSPDKLRSALEGAFADQLAQAVKDGTLTQAQADRIEQRIRQRGLPLGEPGFGPSGPPGAMGMMGGPVGPGPFGVGLDAAAGYLGLTRAALARQLMGGKTLADVAKAQGKSASGLEQALLDAASSELDRAVADGKLTSDQRDAIRRRLREHVADVVAGRGFGMRFHREWRGGPGGPGEPPPGGWPDRP
jgi:hypothetical protein